jgi:hypothetical protein
MSNPTISVRNCRFLKNGFEWADVCVNINEILRRDNDFFISDVSPGVHIPVFYGIHLVIKVLSGND